MCVCVCTSMKISGRRAESKWEGHVSWGGGCWPNHRDEDREQWSSAIGKRGVRPLKTPVLVSPSL